MQGDENKTTREILIEVRQDVKRICLVLQEIKDCRDEDEGRLRRREHTSPGEARNIGKGNSDS